LTLDIQEGILGFVQGAEKALPHAARVVEIARKTGLQLMHVGLGFEPGYPEIGPGESRFSRIKESGAFLKGSDSARTHPSIFKPGDTVLYKNRVSAFAGSSLDLVLRAQGVENLVLMGIATSGIVLSTLRQAADMDYRCTVIKDACFDRDEEVHRVLTENVFAAQAGVLTAEEFKAQVAS
jgi:nicotinamidase-related amidase